MLLLPGQTSAASQRPAAGRQVVPAGLNLHAVEQQEKGLPLLGPSSHCSLPASLPLPQLGVERPMQTVEQADAAVPFAAPSSHCSPGCMAASPQVPTRPQPRSESATGEMSRKGAAPVNGSFNRSGVQVVSQCETD